MDWDQLMEANAALDLHDEAQQRAAKAYEETIKAKTKLK